MFTGSDAQNTGRFKKSLPKVEKFPVYPSVVKHPFIHGGDVSHMARSVIKVVSSDFEYIV